MKRLISFLAFVFVLLAVISHSQPFGPPIYIADPVNMECKYYFAGNEVHFNPRPDNYTVDIGYTTDFKSEEQACEFWRCIYTNGSVKVDQDRKLIEKNLCACNPGEYWDDIYGCVEMKQAEQQKTFLGLIWRWITGFF
jgi:hypothetical protein